MRGLKFLVIFMGILILIGTTFLIYLIILKGTQSKNSSYDSNSSVYSDIKLPSDTKILNMSSTEKHILLHIKDKNINQIIVVDILTGNVIKKININKN